MRAELRVTADRSTAAQRRGLRRLVGRAGRIRIACRRTGRQSPARRTMPIASSGVEDRPGGVGGGPAADGLTPVLRLGGGFSTHGVSFYRVWRARRQPRSAGCAARRATLNSLSVKPVATSLHPDSPARAYAAWVAVCLIWGTTYLAIRISLETIPPLLMASMRWIVAGTLLIALLAARGERRPAAASGRRWRSSASCSSDSATAPSSGRSRPCRAA